MPQVQVLAFIDTYKEGSYLDIPTVNVENVFITKKYIYCISFVNENDKAIQYLENKELKLNKQIWKMP